MPRSPRTFQVVDVGELKPLIAECAAKAGKAPATWARDVLAAAVQASIDQAVPERPAARPAPHRRDDAEEVKFGMRLTHEESEALLAGAKAAGLSQAEYLARLIVAARSGAGTIGLLALQTLAESNRQLLALGRNLNQIAKSLNANPGLMTTMTKADRAFILDAAKVARAHVDVASSALEDLTATRRTAARRRR